MKPKAALALFYSALFALGVAWVFTGSEMHSFLFYLLFITSFSFNAYCGYLELKAGS